MMLWTLIFGVIGINIPAVAVPTAENSVIFRPLGIGFGAQSHAFAMAHLKWATVYDPLVEMCKHTANGRRWTRARWHTWHKVAECAARYKTADIICKRQRNRLRNIIALATPIIEDEDHLFTYQTDMSAMRERQGRGMTTMTEGREKRAIITGIALAGTAVITSLVTFFVTPVILKAFAAGEPNDAIMETVNENNQGIFNGSYDLQLMRHYVRAVETEAWKLHEDSSFGYDALTIDRAIAHVGMMVDRIAGMTAAFIAGDTPIEFITLTGLNETLRRLDKKVRFEGNRLAISTALEMLQCPSTFVANTTGLHGIIEIPVVSPTDKLDVYRHVPWPMRFSDGKWFELSPGAVSILMINKDLSRFRVMTEIEFGRCRKFRDAHICPLSNVLRKTNSETKGRDPGFCLYHLFSHNWEGAKQTCTLIETEPQNEIVQVAEDKFFIRNVKPNSGMIHCPARFGKGSMPFPKSFQARITVTPGCTVDTETHVARAMRAASQENMILIPFQPIDDPKYNWTAVLSIKTRPAHDLSKHALEGWKNLTTTRHMLTHPHSVAHGITWAVMLLLIIGISYGVYCLQRRHMNKKRNTEARHMADAMEWNQRNADTVTNLNAMRRCLMNNGSAPDAALYNK